MGACPAGIDLPGATYAVIAPGMPLANYTFMILPLALVAGSYILL